MRIKSITTLLGMMQLGFGPIPQLGAQNFTVRHNFTGAPDGASPGRLLLNGGTVIGTTIAGGIYGSGSVFACSTNGAGFAVLHHFTNAPDGAEPHELLLNSNMLYGTTRSGGPFNSGTVFKISPSGTGYAVLHGFTNIPDGGRPLSGLATDGNILYGTTEQGGGSGGNGIVFRMDTNGAGYAVLHAFTNTPDGANPYTSLVLSGPNLYGTTYNGGLYGRGTIFKLATNGSAYSVLYNFSNSPDAAFSYGRLVLVSNILYGTTSSGGSASFGGTIFKLATDGTGYAILHSFTGPTTPATNSDGGSPKSGLLFNAGLLYGDTSGGGAGDGGTVFQMNLNGTGFAVLKNFTNATDGSIPQSGLVLTDNTLFGTGYFGGSGGNGTLFSLLLSPAITGQPPSVTVTSGNPVTFSVTAAGQNPLAYQWYYNANLGNPNLLGSSLAGQTASTLAFTSATNSGGYYSVIVTNILGAVTSSPALLTVTMIIVKPTITAQPPSVTVTNGDPVTFTVTATGPEPLAYQWYFNANLGSPNLLGNSLAGQTASTLTFASDTNRSGYYSVIITNTAGAVTSSPALLTVVTVIPKPGITAQPQNLTVTNGFVATFSVAATGPDPLAYQWYFNTNTGNASLLGTALAGETNTTLDFTSALNSGGYYSVIITNVGGAVTSSPALLAVLVANTKPIITAPPQDLTVSLADIATFTVTASGASPLKYQWYSNAVVTALFSSKNRINSQTNATTSVPASFTNLTYFAVIITNSLGTATSSPVLLTIITAPVITSNPPPVSVNSGDPASFTVGVAGASILKFQWYFNTNPVLTNLLGNLLVGQTNDTLAFGTVSNSLVGRYSVIVTNTYGRATSSPALLAISSNAPLPVITLQPLSATLTNGDPVTFTSAATGVGPLRYQWLFSTNTLISGATNPTLTFPNANLPGVYSMQAANSFGSVTSGFALLSVSNRPRLLASGLDPVSGSYAFTFANLAGSTNRLWATTNLAATNFWRTIATNVMPTNELWFFTDTNTAKTNTLRFYRFSTP